MANVGSVIVVGLPEGEVDKVVYQEVNAQQENKQCGESLLIHGGKVETDTHTIDDRYHEISSFYFTGLKFILELPETCFFSTLQHGYHHQRHHQRGDSSHCSQSEQIVILISIGKMQSGAI